MVFEDWDARDGGFEARKRARAVRRRSPGV